MGGEGEGEREGERHVLHEQDNSRENKREKNFCRYIIHSHSLVGGPSLHVTLANILKYMYLFFQYRTTYIP